MSSRLIQNFALAFGIVAPMYLLALFFHCQTWNINNCIWFDFHAFYSENLRASFFAGFLTLGGFLTSLKTFIVVNMKKEVFDTEDYKKAWEKRLEIESKIGGRYKPLQELAESLYYAVACAVTTAVAQLTLGLLPWGPASFACCVLAALSVIYLWQVLNMIRSNLMVLFDHLDAKS